MLCAAFKVKNADVDVRTRRDVARVTFMPVATFECGVLVNVGFIVTETTFTSQDL